MTAPPLPTADGVVVVPAPGRGPVLSREPLVVLYDGRGPTASSPHGDGALRYATTVALPGGGLRWYAEVAQPDGSHALTTSLSPGPVASPPPPSEEDTHAQGPASR